MKAEIVNTFIKSLINVHEMMLGIKPEMKETYLKKATSALLPVLISVGITGDVKGHVILNLSENTAKNLASAMMGGMPVTALDDMTKSALSEMGNMMMGTASTAFSQIGIHTDITPPNCIIGQEMTMVSKSQTIVVVLEAPVGQMLLEISVDSGN